MAGYIGSKAVITSGVSASIDELNIIDGVTATTAELNILDGVTSTAAELNILDGVTSTAAELNILDGVTATATELNLIDGVTATTAELNILDGVTATAAEINLIDGGTARGTTAIVDADGVLVNDAGTMRMTTMATLATYMGTKGLGPAYTRSATAPSSPNAGDWWFHTAGDVLYIYDGTLGWITDKDRVLGQGHFMVPGSFSVLFNGSLTRVPFEGAGLGTVEDDYASVINSAHSEGSFGLSSSVRGVYSGQNTANAASNAMEFIVMATEVGGVDFGNLVAGRGGRPQSVSHATRGVIVGGANSPAMNQMDYITIASAGDATDFGNLSVARQDLPSQAMSSTVRSVFGGGYTDAAVNVLDYITVASTGNATDFGNLTVARNFGACVNNTTRGIHICGAQSGTNNTLDYITIGTAGNATDFGDLASGSSNARVAFHSSTVAYIKNMSEQITMATAANATTTSSFTANNDDLGDSVMPGWIAYNG